MRRLAEFLVMVGVWVGLWRDPGWGNLLTGALLAAATLVAFRRGASAWRLRPLFRPLAVLRLLGYFALKLAEANVVVAWEVVTPANRIREGIVAVPMETTSDVVTTLVANMISLMPGTVTVAVSDEPRILYVHVLHLRDVESMREEVRRLEERAVAALGPPDARRRVREAQPSAPRPTTGEDTS
ncbi:MAG TPA: Na+/H+ antiporter subunit E [Egibacteraceae bacterium]|nr:Na+/H+ antiporter subunit E [Egibacteraceae bacterium]